MKVLPASLRASIEESAEVIRDGKIVAVPTDTFYGLAANPSNDAALDRLLAVKGREEGKGILLLVSAYEMITPFVEVLPEGFQSWGVWPGAVTFLFVARPGLSRLLTGGRTKIGIRMPIAPAVSALCDALGHAITGTSANRAGDRPASDIPDLSPISKDIDLALDGGRLRAELPSTVIDLTGPRPALVRAGIVNFEYLLEKIPR